MCGIAGIWGAQDKQSVRTMMKRLVHRGPDAEGTYSGVHGSLGHRRLSIMDVQGGNQPIYGAGGIRAIVGNGELYNHPKLKKVLSPFRQFATNSDTESALHLYERVGRAAADELDGMFAFAIADGNQLYLARDPVGIKPLYYGTRDGCLAFASEIKALIGVVDDIGEFPPGSYYHTAEGLHRFHRFQERQPEHRSVSEHARRVRETLERAVVKRLMSDVPVGAFLSGGLDSSLIAAIARRHVNALHTFSVGMEGSSDLEAARQVARHLDTVHHEYVFTSDEVADKLPEIIYSLESFDQDLVRSAVPCYFVSRLAADFVKVILTGEGADELFAGYSYYGKIGDYESLDTELRRSVSSLHNINLQRVDRLTMAHSIEGRVPFLDLEMIEVAQSIPPEIKLYPDGDGRRVEKWILRKACEDLLPPEIVWRKKQQFDEGSGTVDALQEIVHDRMSEHAARAHDAHFPEARLRSREECIYHKLLVDAFSDPQPVLKNVARWSERPVVAKSA